MATPTSLFTSDRERRLWCWALAVVVAIYSTLGLAGTLAEVLRENNLMRAAFFFLIYNALSERSENGRRVPAPAVLALVVTVLLGGLDEGIQAFLPNRVYDNFDVFSNAIAAVIGIGASVVIGWVNAGLARRRDRK